MEKINKGKWQYEGEKIRFRPFSYYDWDGEYVTDFEFQVFKRPYFFGLLGKRNGSGLSAPTQFRWGWASVSL